MTLRQNRNDLQILLATTLALAVGMAGRARAQDDDDDLDKIPPAGEEHHVVKPGTAPAPDEDEEATPPRAEHPVAPAHPVETAPSPAPEEEAPAPAHEAPPPTPHAKIQRRCHKVKKKVVRGHGKHKRVHWVEQQVCTTVPVPVEAPPAEHRIIEASPAPSPGLNDEDEGGPPPSAKPHEPGEGEARRSSGDEGDMNFDLGVKSKSANTADVDAIARKVKTRRSMLLVHQGFGIATAALMAATVISGQLNYSDRFGGNGSSGQYEIWHSGLEAATVVSFTTAGLLAIFTPKPFESQSEGVDTVTIHKYSMLVATIGMAAEVPLGVWTVTREGYANQGTLALTHLIVGYVTAAALTAGATALFF